MRTSTIVLLAALAALPGCGCDTVPPDAVEDCTASAVLPARWHSRVPGAPAPSGQAV